MDSKYFLVACGLLIILVGIVFVANSQPSDYQQKQSSGQAQASATTKYCKDASGSCKAVSTDSRACSYGSCTLSDYRLANPPAGTSCVSIPCPDGLQGKSCNNGGAWGNNCDMGSLSGSIATDGKPYPQ